MMMTTFALLLLILSPSFASSQDVCTLCFNGRDPGNPDGRFGGRVTCAEAVTRVPQVFAAGTNECLETQSDGFFFCSCPNLPPKNPEPFCTVCPNNGAMRFPNVVLADFFPGSQATCGQYDRFLSHSMLAWEGDFAQLECGNQQWSLFSGNNPCGCDDDAFVICPLCAGGDTPVNGFESIMVNDGASALSYSTCGELQDSLEVYSQHERVCGLHQHQAANAGCCRQGPPTHFAKPACNLCEHGPPTNAATVVDDPIFQGLSVDCGSMDSEITYLSPKDDCDALVNTLTTAADGCICPAPPATGFGICFSGETTVETKSRGAVLMKDLEIGEEVLTPSGDYHAVYSFGHKQANVMAEYLKVSPSGLEISKNHMLFLQDGRAIPASLLREGDVLASGEEVSAIRAVTRTGVYAPFTTSGDIVVNGVASSSYVSFQDSDRLMIGNCKTPFSFHFLAHTATLPLRVWWHLTGSTTETYTPEGLSKWIEGPHSFMQWLFDQQADTFVAFWFPMTIIVMTMALIELLFSTPSGLGAIMICFFYTKQARSKKIEN